MRTKLKTSGAALLLFASALAGCGEDNGAGCTDECDTVDALQCYGSVIEVCAENDDGCLAWTAQTHCEDTGRFCDDSGGTPECVSECSDECPTDGDTRCSGEVIQTCSEGTDGCLDWTDGTDCSDTDQFCNDSGDDAVCVDECSDECLPVDDTRCTGTVIETCTVGTDGCTEWVAGTDCDDSSEVCSEATGSAACVAPCPGDCDTEGDTQCTDADMIQRCTLDDEGCLYWDDVVDCTTLGYTCNDEVTGDAYCVAPCESECDTVDATQCSGDTVQTCTLDEWNGCLYWEDTTDCTTSSQECDVVGGTAACYDPAVILLMGEDVDATGWDEYRAALAAASVRWDEVDMDTDSFPSTTELAAYEALILFDEGLHDLTDTECGVIADWLDTGKNLFVNGVDYMWNLRYFTTGGGEEALYNALGTIYQGDYAGTGVSGIEGVTGDPITDDFATTPLALAGTDDSDGDYADETVGLSTKAGLYGTGGSGSGHAALTHYDSGTFKTVWLGVNFHNGLSDATQQATLMDNILTYFGL
jgi:hypothetical protein